MNAAAGGRDAEPFPWEAVMHAGFCLLRLSPDIFWRLTPVEFFAMTGGLRPRRPEMARDGLERMMEKFPDGVACGRVKMVVTALASRIRESVVLRPKANMTL